jgi:hypothetical protein
MRRSRASSAASAAPMRPLRLTRQWPSASVRSACAQHVAPVDLPRMSIRGAGMQPLALEDLHPAQPGLQVRAVQPHLQPMADLVFGDVDAGERLQVADPELGLPTLPRHSRSRPSRVTLQRELPAAGAGHGRW